MEAIRIPDWRKTKIYQGFHTELNTPVGAEVPIKRKNTVLTRAPQAVADVIFLIGELPRSV